MSCRRYQEELSLNLDGRLPGTRRAAVLAHVDTCAKCAQVWDELQSTQSLLFDIEPPIVSPRFRDQVWDRIHAGEGSTEILLQEPISTGTKLRYGLVGAAAAALFVVGLQLITKPGVSEPTTELAAVNEPQTGDENEPRKGPTQIDPPQVADVTPPSQTRPTDAGPSRSFRGAPSAPTPFATPTMTAGQLASETVERVTTAAKQLRLYRGRILGKQPLEKPHQQKVLRCVQTIEGGVFVLDRLQRKDLLVLESSSQECLAAARSIIRVSDAQSKVYNLVRTLDQCQLDRLNEISYKVKLRQFQEQADPLAEMLLDVGFREMLKHVAPRRNGMFSLMLQYSGHGQHPVRIEVVPSTGRWMPQPATGSNESARQETGAETTIRVDATTGKAKPKRLQKRR